MTINLPFQQLPHGAGVPQPEYATAHSAGLDLYAAVDQDVTLKPGEWKLVPTGYAIALPIGYEAQIRPRSGMSLKHGITVLNSPGTVDADYRGEVKVVLMNMGTEDFTVTRGMRFAQLVIAEHAVVRVELVDELPAAESERSVEGFGSTGNGTLGR